MGLTVIVKVIFLPILDNKILGNTPTPSTFVFIVVALIIETVRNLYRKLMCCSMLVIHYMNISCRQLRAGWGPCTACTTCSTILGDCLCGRCPRPTKVQGSPLLGACNCQKQHGGKSRMVIMTKMESLVWLNIKWHVTLQLSESEWSEGICLCLWCSSS